MSLTPSPGSLAIEQLAAVIAAQGDGFDLAEILELEGLSSESWRGAKQQWMPKLALDETLRSRYDASLTDAQERLTRAVSPIESELSAWVSFLGECETKSAEAVAEQHGLTLNDFARLQRKWQARFEEDGQLADQAKELRRDNDPVALTIEVEQRPLRPSPYAPQDTQVAAKQTAKQHAANTDTATADEMPQLSLEVLAAILIEFSLGIELTESYQSHGFASAPAAQGALVAWQQQLDSDPDMQDALQDVLDRQRQHAQAAAAPSTQEYPLNAVVGDATRTGHAHKEHFRSPWKGDVDGTADALPALELPPLPFDSTGTFQPVALSDEELAAAREGAGVGDTAFATPAILETLPFEGSAPLSISVVDETALSVPALQFDAPLPFDDGGVVADAEGASRAVNPLDATAGLDAQLLAIDELPFTDASASDKMGGAAPLSASLDATSFVDSGLIAGGALPFDGGPTADAAARRATTVAGEPLQPHQAKPGEVAAALQHVSETGVMNTLSSNQLAPVPLPFRAAKRRPKAQTLIDQLPDLTVDQYACYIAERVLYPGDLAQVRQRYGVPSEDGHGVMALRWAARLAAHPAQHGRYRDAYQQYLDWLHGHHPGASAADSLRK